MLHLLPTLFEEIENSCNGVTIGESEEMVFIDLPIPGAAKDQIQIQYEKGALLVNAEEAPEEKSPIKYFVKASRQYSFRIPVPTRIDENAAPEAHYTDGILRVKFFKSKAERPLKIAVK